MSSTPPTPPPATLASGTVIDGRYEITAILGRGAMGAVFAARHLDLGAAVAVKVLTRPLTGAAPARFLREARACSQIASEHVARVMDYGTLEDGRPYMVMERLEGTDLKALIAKGPLEPSVAASIVLQVAKGLAAAHAKGVVHRDVKPANLFVSPQEGASVAKVLDFGISRMESDDLETLTQSESVLGTPYYMSPEQVRSPHHVDARSDIWSLGVVLYECLTGVRPFDGPTASSVFAAILEQPAPRLGAGRSDVPPGLAAICERCLQKDPAARFADMREVVAALTALGSTRSSSPVLAVAKPVVVTPPTDPPAHPLERTEPDTLDETPRSSSGSSKRGLVIAAATLAVAVLVALAVQSVPSRDGPAPGESSAAVAASAAPEPVPAAPTAQDVATEVPEYVAPTNDSSAAPSSSPPATARPPAATPRPPPRPTLY